MAKKMKKVIKFVIPICIVIFLLILWKSIIEAKYVFFEYPYAIEDQNGEYTAAWEEYTKNTRINTGPVNYDVRFYTTTSSLDAVISYYENSIESKQFYFREFNNYGVTVVHLSIPNGTLILTYATINDHNASSLTIEQLTRPWIYRLFSQ